MSAKAFTLVEIMIVVAIIGMLAAIAIPMYNRARTTTQIDACINNLRSIDGAKDRFALENGLVSGAAVQKADLMPYFVKRWQECPASGTYTINPVATDPTCSIGGAHTY